MGLAAGTPAAQEGEATAWPLRAALCEPVSDGAGLKLAEALPRATVAPERLVACVCVYEFVCICVCVRARAQFGAGAKRRNAPFVSRRLWTWTEREWAGAPGCWFGIHWGKGKTIEACRRSRATAG